MQDTTTQDSLTDEPDTTAEQEQQDQRTVSERKADRMAMLSPLGHAIEGRPFGHPPRAEMPPVWADQLSRVGLDYDAGHVTQAAEYEANAGYVAEAVGALQAMQEVLTVVMEAREKVKKDPTLTQAAMVLTVAAFSDARTPAATRKVDAAWKALDTRIAEAEASLREGIPGHATGSVASEIRAHVKAMRTSADRMAFLRGLVAAGDLESLAAVVKSKPFLSGLTQVEVDLLVHNFNAQTRPELPARIDFLKRTRAHLERAWAPFILDMQRAVGVKYETVNKLRAAKAAAQLS